MRRASAHSLSSIEPLQFRLFPVFFAAVFFCCGITAAHFAWRPPALLLVGVLLHAGLGVFAVCRAPRISLAPLAAIFFLLGAFCLEASPKPDPQKELALLADGTPLTVEGTVLRVDPVRLVETRLLFFDKTIQEKSQQIRLSVTAIGIDSGAMHPLSGGLAVTLYAPPDAVFPQILCGSSVRGRLAFHLVNQYLDPGVWNERAYLLGEGIGAVGRARLASFALLPRTRHASLACWLHSIQEQTSTKLMDYTDAQSAHPGFFHLNHDDASMLTAMLTGDRSYLSRGVRTGFERTGSFHLLVVSGVHLAIFAGLIFSLAKLLRLPRTAATAATILLAFAYALFTGYGQPVQRSFWMITLYLLGRLLWRERSALNAIGFAALGILAFRPQALFDAGFQMTLLSVVAIAGISVPIAEKTFAPYLSGLKSLWLLPLDPALPPTVAQFRVTLRLAVECIRPIAGRMVAALLPLLVKLALRIAELLLISLIVECIMSLPMAIYFHRITVAALPVNLLVLPLVGLLLPSAILTLLAVLLLPVAAWVPAGFTAVLLHSVRWLVDSFSHTSGFDVRIPGPPYGLIPAWILCVAFAVWMVRQRRFAIPAALFSLLAAATIAVMPREIIYHRGSLEVTTIDVGQGDSILVVSPEGKTLLVDAGGIAGASPDSKFDMGEDVVSEVLWARGIRHLDAVAITHAHADHIGGMPAVLANFHPRELWIGINPHSAAYDHILDEAASLGIALKHHAAGDAFPFGSVQIRVLSPQPGYVPKAIPMNDDSLVMQLRYGHTSALLEGDAEAPSEWQMLPEGGLHSDLLKVGHHGSKTSTTPAFLQAVSPEYAAISVGRRNIYGHPKLATLEKLETAHARTYRTDLLGISTFYLDGKQVTASH